MAIDAEEVQQYLNTLPEDSMPQTIIEEKVRPTDNRTIELITKQYHLFSLIALVSNILLIAVFFWGKPDTLTMIIMAAVIAVSLFFSVYKSQQALTTLGIRADKNIDIPLFVLLLAGFPFYFLFYGYNRLLVNQLISESNTTV